MMEFLPNGLPFSLKNSFSRSSLSMFAKFYAPPFISWDVFTQNPNLAASNVSRQTSRR